MKPASLQFANCLDKWGKSVIQISWYGTGYWSRANPEQCLLATHGLPKRRNANVPKLIVAPRREHSRKPDEAYTRIQNLCYGPYLELFARQKVEGWDSIGNEAEIGPRTARKWPSRSPKSTKSGTAVDIDLEL